MVSEDDLDEMVRIYERDGFVNAGRVLDPVDIAALTADVEPYADCLARGVPRPGFFPGYAGDLGRTPQANHFQISSMSKISEPFRLLTENQQILQVAARLAHARTLQLWCDIVQYKPARHGAAFCWHQDAPYHHTALEPPEMILAAWVALDDADEETGCMWMVPGSHRWGVRETHLWSYKEYEEVEAFNAVGPPPGAFLEHAGEWRGAVPCRVRAGDLHFHHALTWHGSPANRGAKPRRACTINYLPDGIRATGPDPRILVPAGTPMIDAGPEFPVIYRAP
jgi:phytanoyl-CoA hydroxylase